MKRDSIIKRLLICLLIISAAASCEKEVLPEVTTSEITEISVNSAMGGGSVFLEGTSPVIRRGVCWSINPKPTIKDSFSDNGAGIGDFTSSITNLNPGTKYYFRAFAVSEAGIGYGPTKSFKTLGDTPSVISATVTGITNSEAILIAKINPNYVSTQITFEYGTTTAYELPAKVSQSEVTGTTDQLVFIKVTGLIANTNYHFRIKAVNSVGTTHSVDFLFKSALNGYPTNGLVAYYSFIGGTALDFSGNNNHATIAGPLSTADRLSRSNEAFQFSTEDDMLLVNNPNFLNNSAGSITAWVKFSDVSRTQYIASVGDVNTNTNYFGLLRLDGTTSKISLYMRDPDATKKDWINGSTVLSSNVYYHVALTSDGSMYKLYINGDIETLEIVAGNNTGRWFNTLLGLDNFVIGNGLFLKPYVSPHMTGIVDEVLLFNRELSETEIEQIFMSTSKK